MPGKQQQQQNNRTTKRKNLLLRVIFLRIFQRLRHDGAYETLSVPESKVKTELKLV